jgi:hypothetical protein
MSQQRTGLSPHPHSGKLLPHRHTSYAGLAFVLMLVGLAMVAATMVASPFTQAANDITITGLVPGTPPAVAPSIDEPTGGSHVFSSPVTVKGSCIVGDIVVIAHNIVDGGSVQCDTAGRYSLQISVYDGRNDLVARQYDGTSQVSPLSPPVTIFYDSLSDVGVTQRRAAAGRPIQLRPAIPGTVVPVIKTPYRYQGATAGKTFKISFDVSGGTVPYAINFDWGDGNSSLRSNVSGGTVEQEHLYQEPGIYKLIIKLTDAEGETAFIQTIIQVSGLESGAARAVISPQMPGRLLVAWPAYFTIVVLVSGFWLGELYDRQRWAGLPK